MICHKPSLQTSCLFSFACSCVTVADSVGFEVDTSSRHPLRPSVESRRTTSCRGCHGRRSGIAGDWNGATRPVILQVSWDAEGLRTWILHVSLHLLFFSSHRIDPISGCTVSRGAHLPTDPIASVLSWRLEVPSCRSGRNAS